MGDIADFYTELRGAEDADALPITVRSLETIIRLSTAVAKSRLAKGAPASPWLAAMADATCNTGCCAAQQSRTVREHASRLHPALEQLVLATAYKKLLWCKAQCS